MNDDARLKGSSVPLASSNIGQSERKLGENKIRVRKACAPGEIELF